MLIVMGVKRACLRRYSDLTVQLPGYVLQANENSLQEFGGCLENQKRRSATGMPCKNWAKIFYHYHSRDYACKTCIAGVYARLDVGAVQVNAGVMDANHTTHVMYPVIPMCLYAFITRSIIICITN